MLFPERADGEDPRLCPACNAGRLGLKTGKFGAFVGCSNYPECRYTRQFGTESAAKESNGPMLLGIDPASGEPVTLRDGRFGAYVQIGEAEKPPRASIPKDMAVEGPYDLDTALKLLALPRTIGDHPETGEPIIARHEAFTAGWDAAAGTVFELPQSLIDDLDACMDAREAEEAVPEEAEEAEGEEEGEGEGDGEDSE